MAAGGLDSGCVGAAGREAASGGASELVKAESPSGGHSEAVRAYMHTYGLAAGDLLDASTLFVDGEFGGEADFVDRADRDYGLDRHAAFAIGAAEAALIVVDMQEDFVRPTSVMCQPGAFHQLPAIRHLADVARGRGMPVIFTAATYPRARVNDTPAFCGPVARGVLAEGSAGTEIAVELAVRPDETVLRTKHTYDAFFGTELDSLLRGSGVRTVIVCGTMTNYCCEATARGAFDRGYHVVFGSDVTSTDSAINHAATLRTMRRGYARVMTGREIEEALTGLDRLYDLASAEEGSMRS